MTRPAIALNLVLQKLAVFRISESSLNWVLFECIKSIHEEILISFQRWERDLADNPGGDRPKDVLEISPKLGLIIRLII